MNIKRHRLIATLFIENINKYAIVNHLNHKTHDNKVSNLEFCTQKQNTQHGNGVKCILLNIHDNTQMKYTTLQECADYLNFAFGTKYLDRSRIRKFIDNNITYKNTYKFYLD